MPMNKKNKKGKKIHNPITYNFMDKEAKIPLP